MKTKSNRPRSKDDPQIKALLARRDEIERKQQDLDEHEDEYNDLDEKRDRIEDKLEALGYQLYTTVDCSDWYNEYETESKGDKNPFKKAYTPYGDGHLPILAIMHGQDVHHARRFQQEDPNDRKAFCAFVRGYLIYNFACVLHTNEKYDVMNMQYPDNPPKAFDANDRWHRACGAALHRTKASYSEWKDIRRSGKRGRQLMEDLGLAIEEQARFRISLALFSSKYEHLSLRDLRVLFAVNSCIAYQAGDDDEEEGGSIGIMHLGVLAMRAVGASNSEQLKLLGVQPLTEMQVRRSLDRLEENGMIRRLTVGRTTFAARGRMPEDAFHALVAARLRRGKAKRGFIKGGKLHVEAQVA